MLIRARMSVSADGYVTTPSGWPTLVADPAFVLGQMRLTESLSPDDPPRNGVAELSNLRRA